MFFSHPKGFYFYRKTERQKDRKTERQKDRKLNLDKLVS